MKRLAFLSMLLSLSTGAAAAGQEKAKTHQVKLNGHTFTLPAGFDIELVAGPPLVNRPIHADFDEAGRLYVSDSSGSNENVQEQLKKKPHRILRLEDTKGTGKFDQRTIFADKMMFPEGVMWHAGSLYVAAVPVIWKLTDTHGNGIADQRVEWFNGKTLTGCANDLHGPYPGPDGWIYWCKGAFAPQTYERPGKAPFVTRAAHIFRARPDGTGIEPVMTGGMDNPVKVVFTPGGERIFTTTFLQHPGGGKRDGLIHAIYGGIYGKDWDVIYSHKWTGPSVMPVLTHLGAAAPCGLVRYESQVFGPEYQDNLFACLFNMQKVTRHVLTPHGATFKCRDEDFLVSDNKDFHPTDVLEDADGSLLVIDTGGWYKLCCPTSQLHKPDVLGAIYRVRKSDAPRVLDPRGLRHRWSKMTVSELVDRLGDFRPAVRHRAIQTLAAQGEQAVDAIAKVLDNDRRQTTAARMDAVWTLTRIEHPRARAAVRKALADPDETVRQAVLHSIGVWRDREALRQLCDVVLHSSSSHNQRAAAEALGRISDSRAVPRLLTTAGQWVPADRVLEHSLTFALIEIDDAEAIKRVLQANINPRIERTGLIALDQMGAKLTISDVKNHLASSDPKMNETAWWIVSRHPEWGGELAGFLRARLAAKNLTAAEQGELARQLAKLARGGSVQALLAQVLEDTASPAQARRIILRAMAQAGLKEAPAAWTTALTQTLTSADGDLLRETLTTARALRISKQQAAKLVPELLRLGQNNNTPADVRLGALAAVPGGLTKMEPSLFTFVRSQLNRDFPAATRSTAAEVLSRAKLTSAQLVELTGSLKTIGPMELDRVLEAFAQSADDQVGKGLLAALKTSPTKAALRVGMLQPRLAKFGPGVRKQAEELYAALNVDANKQKARLDLLLTTLKNGDVRRGQLVFNSQKTACVACHAIGYLGGNVGPDLTHIGKIRSERDLLEAIVFPSASFVRSYEPVVVTTRDGRAFNGVIRKDAADEIVLATGVNQEVRLARDEIEDMQPSQVSVMPAGLDQQLTPRELADLVAFLKACK
jgi:putative membrane-bound dehydrogenase-like protein